MIQREILNMSATVAFASRHRAAAGADAAQGRLLTHHLRVIGPTFIATPTRTSRFQTMASFHSSPCSDSDYMKLLASYVLRRNECSFFLNLAHIC